MKTRIYLFCNTAYGKAYYDVFHEFAKYNIDVDCFVVISIKYKNIHTPKRPAIRIKQLVDQFNRYYQQIKSKYYRLNLLFIEDVNSSNFSDAIPIGSIGFIAGFNQIFKYSVIEKFSLFINFHPSLLPYYRGAIPSYWVIENKENISGFTAHIVSEKIDTGEIIYQESISVNQDISETELDYKISLIGSNYFKECLQKIQSSTPLGRGSVNVQYSNPITYTPASRRRGD